MIINPTGFLFGNSARFAIKNELALPFAGQEKKVAFSMIEIIENQKLEIGYVKDCFHSPLYSNQIRKITTASPLAGLPEGSLIMGILNVTPDSFSDGGKHYSSSTAIRAAHKMVEDGATVIDIGGESTRPGSQPVSTEEECSRIIPVVKALKGCGAYLSVDTRHAETMKYALDAGADLINDISALDDRESAQVISQAQCPVILMHMRGNPQTMHQYKNYNNVLVDVFAELQRKIQKAVNAGIRRENVILDPGIGFAKNNFQNMELLKKFPAFANLGCRLLLAVSRKRFIREIAGKMNFEEYDVATMIASSPAFYFGNSIIRVHNVPAAVQSMKMWQTLYG
ncbi:MULTISPECIES: dihydropteroate synthase [unclassified Commensalibacter]|uniref:dihydropteroate synthase n=1 Tax=unclassified Commensalibacter TaxID=2630218 RepID=UPI0018DB80BB|nr:MULTISPECIES: dihydropteroate synthase [unclassified Commensalibacter]MBH9969879.1 dihydropteroate synthase [Commensalibacter sp. M0265]MBH9977225.1 dihydropteroate synthase [Commensalibacter sp. M0266]MBH9992914.1 dihydropteroate synthase [Commensalibacter sp. M0270]MBI0046401.1 dihydropteroate synthase [Commensalibacter sp. M0267]MBI0056079.1 dihydropteroate synthase [Commensalibacter sp. M0268]